MEENASDVEKLKQRIAQLESKNRRARAFMEEELKRKKSTLSSVISLTIALVGFAIIFYITLDSYNGKKVHSNIQYPDSTFKKQLSNQIDKLQYSRSQIDSLYSEFIKMPEDKKFSNKDFEVLKFQISETQKSLENLNSIILDNPEKALSIPLLKKDLSNLQTQNDAAYKSIRDDVARVYDMNKWIIGLVFTMLVSIVVLNISNLLSKKKES